VSNIHQFNRDELEQYIWNMPHALADSIRAIKARSEGTTYGQRERNAEMIDAVREMWIDLMEQLSPDLFGERTAGQVFDDAMRARIDIYRLLQEPNGLGTGGTIAPQMVASAVFEDAKQFVQIAAERLIGLGVNAERWSEWRRSWAVVDVSA
jgi:hypothetical protein